MPSRPIIPYVDDPARCLSAIAPDELTQTGILVLLNNTMLRGAHNRLSQGSIVAFLSKPALALHPNGDVTTVQNMVNWFRTAKPQTHIALAALQAAKLIEADPDSAVHYRITEAGKTELAKRLQTIPPFENERNTIAARPIDVTTESRTEANERVAGILAKQIGGDVTKINVFWANYRNRKMNCLEDSCYENTKIKNGEFAVKLLTDHGTEINATNMQLAMCRILELLSQEKCSKSELFHLVKTSHTGVDSKQNKQFLIDTLDEMSILGLIEVEENGARKHYRITDPAGTEKLKTLQADEALQTIKKDLATQRARGIRRIKIGAQSHVRKALTQSEWSRL